MGQYTPIADLTTLLQNRGFETETNTTANIYGALGFNQENNSLNNYYTKTYINDNYYTKSEATDRYATITELATLEKEIVVTDIIGNFGTTLTYINTQTNGLIT